MLRGSLPAVLHTSSLVSLLALPLAASAAPRQERAPSPEAVNGAIERGVGFLLRSQNRDGSWGVDVNERGVVWHDLRDGSCALAAYTLLKCGFAPDHPAIQRAAAFLVEGMPRHTYASGVQLHALGAIDPEAHGKRMRHLVELLLDLQQQGGWDYPGIGRPDLSNTQVAALGFRAARAAGLSLPKDLWSQLVETALRYQESPVEVPGAADLPKERRQMAGFGYEVGGGVSASMTTAGLTILGIVREDPARADSRLLARIDAAGQLGLNWLEQHYSIEGNPGGEAAWHHYYLYGLERVGALFGKSEIGGHDWYREGALQLLKEQRADGGWWNEGRTRWPPAPLPIANTCFALLFLRKATLSPPGSRREHFASMEEPDSDVWVRVDAKQVWTVWLSGFAPEVLGRHPPVETKDGPRPGLFVEKVEWWVEGELVESVRGDAETPWRDERFALRFDPPRGGELELECRVTVRAASAPRELRSRPLRVRHELALEPWMLEYARDASRNLFAGQELMLTVSSEESEFHPKADVLDGLQGSAWWARDDDPEPWLLLECAKGVRLKELWLSPAAASEVLREQCLPFTELELRLNDAKVPLLVRLDPDERLKTKFVLPKPTLVKSLELRVRAPAYEAGKCIGLAEIEGR
jgi:hypothetical protein